jgi:hypothetical protein
MSPASKCSLRWDPPISAGSCRWNAAVRVREEKAARTTGKPEHDANLTEHRVPTKSTIVKILIKFITAS